METYWFVSGVLISHSDGPFTAFRRKVVSSDVMFDIDRLEGKVSSEFSHEYSVLVTNFIKLTKDQFDLIPGGGYQDR